ncbi:hypothetical protein L1887_11530 [Cichorium endivia]|nr:hypothetical protein L1887_11530 [Cichorium endivia]
MGKRRCCICIYYDDSVSSRSLFHLDAEKMEWFLPFSRSITAIFFAVLLTFLLQILKGKSGNKGMSRDPPEAKGKWPASRLALAALIQQFELKNPSNEPVDMTEIFGVTVSKATPLEVLLAPRLSLDMYPVGA